MVASRLKCSNMDWPPCQGPCRIPACEETRLRAVISRITKSPLAQRIFRWNLDKFAEELSRAQMCVWEVPGWQVLGCQDCLEYITAASEMLLLISDSSTAPYQSFLFSSTLFSPSSWFSQRHGRVSLISYLFSSLFSVICLLSPSAGHGAAYVCRAEPRGRSRPCPLAAACSPAAACPSLSCS